MQTKILNFIEAGEVYNLLSKYEIKDFDDLSPFQFVERFLEVVIPEDYLEFLRLLFGSKIEKINLPELIKVVSDNNINLLVKTFENINGKPKS